MNLILESNVLEDYLKETEEIDYSHFSIVELAFKLEAVSVDRLDFIRKAYEYVRDEIPHSWDIQSSRITCTASEALQFREGICYAKSNLLCAILRQAGIPAGYCYQRLTLGDTPDSGFCIHALNAVYIASFDKWIRLDARGNKPGVHAEFSLDQEQLAFPVRRDYGEVDYDVIYTNPNPKTMDALRKSGDCTQLYRYHLPEEL